MLNALVLDLETIDPRQFVFDLYIEWGLVSRLRFNIKIEYYLQFEVFP